MYYYLRFSGISDSIDFMAFITSYRETGPTEIWETGIFWVLRYSRRASREPKVEAATPTPKFSNLNFFYIFCSSSWHSIIASSTSYSVFATIKGLPATA